jgi:sugar phosphate isomerase/epimerase
MSLPLIGLSSSSAYPESTAATFEIASSLGYDGVEIMVGTDAISQDPEALKALVDHYQVPVLSIHAPCLLVTQRVWGTDPWGKLMRAQRAAEQVGASTVVVHPPFRWQRAYARAFTEGLQAMQSETEVVFAVENMYPWRAGPQRLGAYAPSWDLRDADYPHVTIDLSHTAVSGLDPVGLAREMGDRLQHVHLADGSGSALDEHLLPGRGRQPVEEFLRTMRGMGFARSVILEVSTRGAATKEARRDMLREGLHLTRAHLSQ